MPKMTRWDSREPIDVASEKAAVYAAQGWVTVNAPVKKVQPAIVREPVVHHARQADSAGKGVLPLRGRHHRCPQRCLSIPTR